MIENLRLGVLDRIWGKIFLGRFFSLFFLLCVSCARVEPVPTAPLSLYEKIPRGKSLRAIPEFFLVDDFNERELKNRLDSVWSLEGRKEERIEFGLVRDDTFQEKRGGSLYFKTSLPSGERRVLKSALKSLDMSEANGIVFACRAETGESVFSGKMELILKDFDGREKAYDFTSVCFRGPLRSEGWREVILPRNLFSGIDWGKLKEVSFALGAGPKPAEGMIGIDEIAFYGKGDIRFRSEADNLIGFPKETVIPGRREVLLREASSEKFLYEVARDTWKYFENAVDRTTKLPVDHIRVSEPRSVGAYTTPTNLALYFLACVAAHELGFISRKEAIERIQATIATLRRMKRWQGFYYNFYHTATLEVTRDYVSAVDSGWLAAAWVVLRQAFPKELGELMSQFLEEIDFSEFYDPSVGQLRLGFDEARGEFSPYHYGILATEARATSFVGIAKGDLPREHWWSIYRTLPKDWTWQSQVPEGKEIEIEGKRVFEGYYTYRGKKFVPSWGGSLFEFLMPSLVMKEKELAPEGLGLNNRIATEIHIDYALNRQGYPIWGLSPASTSSGRMWLYGEYGVRYLGVKGYRDEGVIAPYASALALDTLPDQAIDNMRQFLEFYEVYGPYGFYDTANVRTGRVNQQYLALDQGMILVAIANYLRNGLIQNYFHQDKIVKETEDLLKAEKFFQT